MRERVEAAGGKLNVCATPGNGTRLEITVPIDLARAAS
jgi:signal transduction histidine kinase